MYFQFFINTVAIGLFAHKRSGTLQLLRDRCAICSTPQPHTAISTNNNHKCHKHRQWQEPQASDANSCIATVFQLTSSAQFAYSPTIACHQTHLFFFGGGFFMVLFFWPPTISHFHQFAPVVVTLLCLLLFPYTVLLCFTVLLFV